MSFFDFVTIHKLTRREREVLAWHLAMLRARKTYLLLAGVSP